MHVGMKVVTGVLLGAAGYGWFTAVSPRPVLSLGGETVKGRSATNDTVPHAHLTARVEAHLRECAQRPAQPLTRTSLFDSEVILADATFTTGSIVSGYIIARDAEQTATCQPHDFFEVTAWSDRNRAFVTVESIGYGVYSFRFTPKIPGTFSLCFHLMYESSIQIGKSWPSAEELYSDFQNASFWAQTRGTMARLKKTPTTQWCEPRADFVKRCVAVAVAGAETLPPAPCAQTWHNTNGLAGSWVKALGAACYPGLCEGDLAYMASDGWVWVPDHCYLRLYNRESAWDCMSGRSVLWFGDSTLKQPATNLVENLLGVPVLRRSFNWVRKFCPKGKRVHKRAFEKRLRAYTLNGCYGPFDHRQWRVNRTNPLNASQVVHLQLVWGGSVALFDPPMRKPAGHDLLLEPTPAREAFYDAVRRNPDFIFLHEYVWDDVAMMDQPRFLREIRALLEMLFANTTAKVHWDTAHPQCLSDALDNNVTMCQSAIENKLRSAGAYQSSLGVLRHFEESFGDNPRLTQTERFQMAQPHVMELKYCYFGIHFGSQDAFCHVTKAEAPDTCTRDWLVDKFEAQIWMNKMCTNAPASTSQDPTVTIEVCALFISNISFQKSFLLTTSHRAVSCKKHMKGCLLSEVDPFNLSVRRSVSVGLAPRRPSMLLHKTALNTRVW